MEATRGIPLFPPHNLFSRAQHQENKPVTKYSTIGFFLLNYLWNSQPSTQTSHRISVLCVSSGSAEWWTSGNKTLPDGAAGTAESIPPQRCGFREVGSSLSPSPFPSQSSPGRRFPLWKPPFVSHTPTGCSRPGCLLFFGGFCCFLHQMEFTFM